MKLFTFALTLLTLSSACAQGQTPSVPVAASVTSAVSIPPPVPPLLALYRFWPEQFVQWVGTELPYSMVEFDVDTVSGKEIYNLTLVDRATQKRTYYSNTPLIVAMAKAQSTDAYLASDIKFVRPDSATTGAIYTVNLTLHDGKPLQWRFIQGSDVMEQGGGLTAMPTAPSPILAYREQAAVAGEGTVIQIGDTASNAEPWTEISRPPYFMAWHGAYSLNATTLVLPTGDETWSIVSAPTTLNTGATWKLNTPTGREMNISVEKVEGNRASLLVEGMPGSPKRTIEATWDGTAWQYSQVRYIPHLGEKVALTLQFSPALAGSGPSNLDILEGKKKIATATATIDANKNITISFKSPDWAKTKALTETISMTTSELKLQAIAH